MSTFVSRRDLIGRMWGQKADPIRPPWAIRAPKFTEICTACGDCVAACPRSVLDRDHGGYPEVVFSRGACDFCGACARACPEPVFRPLDRAPWRITAVFGDDCLSARGITCRVCAEWCEAHAIRFRLEAGGRARPHVEGLACTGCGACVSVCPASAIRVEEAA